MLVKGRVLDTDGAPIANAKVECVPMTKAPRMFKQNTSTRFQFARCVSNTTKDVIGSTPFGQNSIPFPMMALLGKCWRTWGAIPSVPRICITSLRRMDLKHLQPIPLIQMILIQLDIAVFGVKESLIAQYKDTTPDSSYQKQWEVEFDFVLAKG